MRGVPEICGTVPENVGIGMCRVLISEAKLKHTQITIFSCTENNIPL